MPAIHSDSMIRLMSIIILPMLLSLAATIAAAAVPLSNGVTLLPSVTNASSLGAIDPRFTTDYQQGQSRLSATSCLMNVVNAMMELALENFTEPIRPQNYIDPAYPEVAIVPIALAQGVRIEARYLLWGIWEGIRWMISHQSFLDLVIGAYWDGILICRIWIGGARRQLRIAGNCGTLGLTALSGILPIDNATVESTQDSSMMDIRNSLNDQHLTVSVTHLGEVLGITEVFIAIFTALEYMAHYSSIDELGNFQIFPDYEDTMIGIAKRPQAPGITSPVLEYQWAILSVGQIPEYMLQQRRFMEVVIEIAVDGVPLGDGFLSKLRL